MHWENDTVQFRIVYVYIVNRGGTQRKNSVLSANLTILADVVLQRWGEGRIFRGNIYA
jgi:hypothetical protein